jgi:acyl dehydratase
LTVPPKERFFEDYRIGEVHEFGDYLVTEQEIIEFARKYDPQPFHTDPQAARDTHFGGLVASGWLTGSIAMRLLVDHYISACASMGSPGIDELRWLKPVRPGDRLRVRIRAERARRSHSKPDRGVVYSFMEVLNQQGETVMTTRSWGMYKCRTVQQ